MIPSHCCFNVYNKPRIHAYHLEVWHSAFHSGKCFPHLERESDSQDHTGSATNPKANQEEELPSWRFHNEDLGDRNTRFMKVLLPFPCLYRLQLGLILAIRSHLWPGPQVITLLTIIVQCNSHQSAVLSTFLVNGQCSWHHEGKKLIQVFHYVISMREQSMLGFTAIYCNSAKALWQCHWDSINIQLTAAIVMNTFTEPVPTVTYWTSLSFTPADP